MQFVFFSLLDWSKWKQTGFMSAPLCDNKQSLLWVNRNVSDYVLSPVTDSESFHPSNRDSTALILNVPLTLETAWDCAMNVHHQLWKITSSKEPTVVQKWIRFWGWLPRCFGDPCFSSFTYSMIMHTSIDDEVAFQYPLSLVQVTERQLSQIQFNLLFMHHLLWEMRTVTSQYYVIITM